MRKKTVNKIVIFLLALIVTLFVALIVMLACKKNVSDAAYNVETISINGKNLKVYIADNESKRSKGLAAFDNIGDDQGMLFVFNKSGTYSFWMKNMNFDIDIIWISDNKIVEINKNIPAQTGADDGDLVNYYSSSPTDKVLEVNAGWAERNNIKIGDKIKR